MSHNRNRQHDSESTEISKRHDKIKADNEKIKSDKEKARLEKYEKPFLEKKSNSSYQIAFRDLLLIREPERDEHWKKQFQTLLKTIQNHDPVLLSSLLIKYQYLKPNTK